MKDLFMSLSTQWRMGSHGPVGLDYSGVREVMGFLGIPRAERREMFEDLQVMEIAALMQIYKGNK